MTAFPILDLIAGLIFIFFLLALVNNSLFELVSSLFKLRSVMLTKWLVETFKSDNKDKEIANTIMNHPLLKGLSKPDKATTYMDGKTFGKTIVELIITRICASDPKKIPILDTACIFSNLDTIGLPANLATTFKTFITKTELAKKLAPTLNEIEHFEQQITEWFDSSMERLGSRFKRKTFLFTAIFASIITITLNVDSVTLANYLYSNPAARQQWAEQAYGSISDSTLITMVNSIRESKAKTDTSKHATYTLDSLRVKIKKEKQTIDSIVGTLNANLPMGWSDKESEMFCHPCKNDIWFIKKIGGWLITILAICVGAPFWFEVLGKIANIRSSIKPKTEEEKAVDAKK